MRVFVWIFCISDLVWVDPVFVDCHISCICGLSEILYLWIVRDPVFVDCHRSCICGSSPGFVDDQDLLERLSGAFASPRLRSVRLSRRLSVCHTRAQILKSASAASKNVDNVDKICPKSSRARGGSPMLWLTARHPGAIHGKRRRVEYLTCFKIISEKTELTKLLWIGHQTSRERRGVRIIWGSSMFDKHRGAQFIGHLSVLCRQADCICYVPNIPLKLWIVWDRDIHLYSQE